MRYIGSPKVRWQYHIMKAGQIPPAIPKTASGKSCDIRNRCFRSHLFQTSTARSSESPRKMIQASKRIDSEIEINIPEAANFHNAPASCRKYENRSHTENNIKNK